MIVKKQIPLAGPRDRSCGNCHWGDPKLHVCCAKDTVLTDEDLAFYSCGSWEPKKVNVFTTTENVIGMPPVNRVEVPLQPDGSLKFKAKETIGITISNPDSVTGSTLKESTGWDHRLEAKALDRGAKQGMTQEALDTVFAIACQQVPSMEKRWMELKAEITVMFAKKWVAEDMPE